MQGINLKRLIKCINYAAIKHKDIRRKDSKKTPYINHPLNCAYIASIIDVDESSLYTIIASIILHDVVEDTDTNISEIAAKFGAEVASIVAEVTDDKSLPKSERKALQIEHAKDLSFKASIAKIVDKIDNISDLSKEEPVKWTLEGRLGYLNWAKTVVDAVNEHDGDINIKALKSIFYDRYVKILERLTS